MAMTGGCLCGNITYTLHGEPAGNFLCHCKNCQKQSGSAFSINLVYAEDQFDCRGEVSTFADTSKSGNPVLRQFCPACGSPIFSSIPTWPGIVVLQVGTLDDTASYSPDAQVWSQSRQNWVGFDKDYPSFAQNPPS